jgi:Rrf2 family protein
MNAVLNISEAASIAMHTAVYLAVAPDRSVSTGEIAEALPVSRNHLSKVMQRLVKAGLVTSVRGPGGGFRLARPAGEIALLEVYSAIEGEPSTARCLFAVPVCGGRNCILGGLIESLSKQFKQYMESKKLADLVGAYGKGVVHEA